MLVIMSGLPASGKTTIARDLARHIGAVHLRIDVIEHAIVRAGAGSHPLGPVGYVIGYALAEDYLRQGLDVVADSVNPLAITREAWRGVARAGSGEYLEVEVICSDPAEYRRRASMRISDIPGFQLPAWLDIVAREYEPWDREHVIVDTAAATVAECVAELLSLVGQSR
ncbi:MAG TPA: adenylyl-sulfate kinase [Actinobacteria bacterium]|nr:adenylyl-sulfate kinase [Actinomycetota bacterium]